MPNQLFWSVCWFLVVHQEEQIYNERLANCCDSLPWFCKTSHELHNMTWYLN